MPRGLNAETRSQSSVSDVLQTCEIDVLLISASIDLADDGARSEELERDNLITIGDPLEANSVDRDEANDHENSEWHAELGCECGLDPRSILSACKDLHRELQLDSSMSTGDSENPRTRVCSLELQTEEKQ